MGQTWLREQGPGEPSRSEAAEGYLRDLHNDVEIARTTERAPWKAFCTAFAMAGPNLPYEEPGGGATLDSIARATEYEDGPLYTMDLAFFLREEGKDVIEALLGAVKRDIARLAVREKLYAQDPSSPCDCGDGECSRLPHGDIFGAPGYARAVASWLRTLLREEAPE